MDKSRSTQSGRAIKHFIILVNDSSPSNILTKPEKEIISAREKAMTLTK